MADKRTKRVFRLERTDIRFPLWRKKVDGSVFFERAILIPKAYEAQWGIPARFKGVASKTDRKSRVAIWFGGRRFDGFVTELQAKRRKDSYRIFYDAKLASELKDAFIMTFMRSLELQTGEYGNVSIEALIPFQEFLDIEFDGRTRSFHFTAHYRQPATFPALFESIRRSTVLQGIEHDLAGERPRILSTPWHRRADLRQHAHAVNVIYHLLDEASGQIYVGEAGVLGDRLRGKRPEIPGWTHFRYDVLPASLAGMRLEIERMAIASLSFILPSSAGTLFDAPVHSYRMQNKRFERRKLSK